MISFSILVQRLAKFEQYRYEYYAGTSSRDALAGIQTSVLWGEDKPPANHMATNIDENNIIIFGILSGPLALCMLMLFTSF